ncbi:hypothetical protein B0H19DRAFT_1071072 [Mycena capillaripes]|nr:hypothetical protein B0H19DRAFT_1071072 [Mycena capillaripes]
MDPNNGCWLGDYRIPLTFSVMMLHCLTDTLKRTLWPGVAPPCPRDSVPDIFNNDVSRYGSEAVMQTTAVSSALTCTMMWPVVIWKPHTVKLHRSTTCRLFLCRKQIRHDGPGKMSQAAPAQGNTTDSTNAHQILDRIAQDYACSTATGSQSNSTGAGGFHTSLPTSCANGGSHNGQDHQPPASHSEGLRARTGNGLNSTQNWSDPRNSFVNVMYWNIYHNFTLKLTDPEFHSLLREYNIMFFAETDMLPGEEDAADVPVGYTLLSLPQKALLNNSRHGGGIALIIRDTFKFTKSKLSSPDILVLDMGSIWLIGAYIPPGTSQWEGWTDVEPLQKSWETVALCTRSDDKPVASLADINAQTGSLQSSLRGLSGWSDGRESRLTLTRKSMHAATQWLKRRFTFWQPTGQSVVDYAIVSASLLPMVQKFHVELLAEDEDDDWADHVRICITLDSKVFEYAAPLATERGDAPNFQGSEYIDQLYQETMDAKETKDEALESLWGPIRCVASPTHIYGSALALNHLQTEPYEYLVPDIYLLTAHVSAKNNVLGWPGSNGDLFKAVVKSLATRHAQTRFVYVQSKENSQAKRDTYTLAKTAAGTTGAHSLFDLDINGAHMECGNVHWCKVTTDLEQTSPVKPKPWITGKDSAEKEASQSHRSRAKVHTLQFALQTELLATKTPKEFWDFICKR